MANQFVQAAAKRKKIETIPSVDVSANKEIKQATSSMAPCRIGTKHIGGYFPPEVAKQLKRISVDEDKPMQELLAEALDLFFQSRDKPTIAVQKST